MKVSMDGLRRNIANRYNAAAMDAYMAITAESGDGKKIHLLDLVCSMEELRAQIGALLAVYSENPDDLMTDMSELELEHADPRAEEED